MCWHKWTKWKKYTVELKAPDTGNVWQIQKRQRRTCTKCSKEQDRLICVL